MNSKIPGFHEIFNSKAGALFLLSMAFALIYNPLVKFPFTFCIIIAFIFIVCYLQDGNLSSLNFKRLSIHDLVKIILIYVGLEVIMDFAIQPLVTMIVNEPADYSGFEGLRGNTDAYLKNLFYGWISAAIGEELLFRAFAFRQLRTLLGERPILIVLLSSILFSLPHLYQGTSGLIMTFLFGLAFGFIYLKFKNIWINIIVHGLIDTLFLTLAYYGMLSFYS